VDLHIHGHAFAMFICRNDDAVALRMLWNHTYETKSTKIWLESARKSRCILDIGAHTGIYSILAALENPKAEIAALEPSPVNFGRLVTNVRGNHLNNVMPMHAAVSIKRGYERFGTPTQQWYLSTGGKLSPERAKEVSMVKTICGDQFDGVDLIKMDTEGNELNCLKGMTDTLRNKPDILFECSSDKEEIFDILHTAGYRIYSVDDKEKTVTQVAKALETNDISSINYWAKR
jgi:FkbM family methyltransferase